MNIDNKLTSFLNGPYIFFGLIFIPVIFVGIQHSNWPLTTGSILIAWYLFGTYSGMEIDSEKRIFKAYNKHFGLFKTGQWRSLDNYIGLTLVPMKSVYRMYSRSNRTNTSEKQEFRIYLVNQAKKPEVEIKSCKTLEAGLQSIDEFSIWLKLPVYSVKH